MKVLKNFIEQFIGDDALMIIMGDHQPNVQITGPDTSWSVPVHVISRDKSLLEPFKSKGYTPGLIPRQPRPHPGMETFLFDFIKSFSSPDGGTGLTVKSRDSILGGGQDIMRPGAAVEEHVEGR
jgi:hypothetical protein